MLSVSGLLIATLGDVLAFSRDPGKPVELASDAHCALLLALLALVVASVLVLMVFLPKRVEWPDAEKLASYTQEHWGATGWDKSVAEAMTTYLKPLREANGQAATQLTAAAVAQVVGIVGIAYAAARLISAA